MMLHTAASTLETRRSKATVRDTGAIPSIFCWTKMGAEAGQSLSAILHRKELERRAGRGTFAWGIGNSLGTSVELARQMSTHEDVNVLFTPMKSAPKAVDLAPSHLLLWMFYQGRNGNVCALPEHMLVTSRGDPEKRTHYALLCRSGQPLEEQQDCGAFDAVEVRNLASLNPVGASQVTSMVRYAGAASSPEKSYRVAFKAALHAEGFVKLVDPVLMNEELIDMYHDLCLAESATNWSDRARALKEAALALKQSHISQKEFLFA